MNAPTFCHNEAFRCQKMQIVLDENQHKTCIMYIDEDQTPHSIRRNHRGL